MSYAVSIYNTTIGPKIKTSLIAWSIAVFLSVVLTSISNSGTHWGLKHTLKRVCIYIYIYIYIYVSSRSSLVQYQAISWTNADLLPVGSLGTQLIEIWIKFQLFSLKMQLKMSSAEFRPFHSGMNTLWCRSCEKYLNSLYWNIIFGNIEISTSAIGHVSPGLLSWCAIFKLSLCKSFEYEAPILKWIVDT